MPCFFLHFLGYPFLCPCKLTISIFYIYLNTFFHAESSTILIFYAFALTHTQNLCLHDTTQFHPPPHLFFYTRSLCVCASVHFMCMKNIYILSDDNRRFEFISIFRLLFPGNGHSHSHTNTLYVSHTCLNKNVICGLRYRCLASINQKTYI